MSYAAAFCLLFGAQARAQVLACPQIGRITLAGDVGSITFGDGVPGYHGTEPLRRSSDLAGYVDYQTNLYDNILIPHELLDGRVQSAGVSYNVPDKANYSDTCTLESGAVAWTLDCSGPGQRIKGAKYTEVAGSVVVDFTGRKLSLDITEKTVSPFTPERWHLNVSSLPITVKTERADKTNPDVLRWELRAEAPLAGTQTENFYTAAFPVLTAGEGFPVGEVEVSVTHTDTADVGERGPDLQTTTSGYELRCHQRR